MRDEDQCGPKARRIRKLAGILQETYLCAQERGHWLENLCAMVVFVDFVIAEVEVSALELDDYSPFPGELRSIVISMLRGRPQEV